MMTCMKIKKEKKQKPVFLSGFLIIVFLCGFINCLGVDYYMIATSSMMPTIQAGQRITINKFIYGIRIVFKKNTNNYKLIRTKGIRTIEPNDVICFNKPQGDLKRTSLFTESDVYCKRILGTPGDRIGAVDGHYWNEKILRPIGIVEEQEKLRWMFDGVFVWNDTFDVFAESGLGWNIKNWGPLIVPAKGMTIHLHENNRELYRHVIEYETGMELGNIDTYTFCDNYYFAVGDNVMNSNDSRYWGFVPADYIIGVVSGWKGSRNNKSVFEAEIGE